MRDKQSHVGQGCGQPLHAAGKDFTGYQNLVKLVTAAYLDGYYYKPRVDKELLARHAFGGSDRAERLSERGDQRLPAWPTSCAKARESMATFRDIFAPGDFYVELHDHGMEAQHKCNRGLITLAREFGLPLVAANDVHFLERAHHEAHDVMICIGTGAMVFDEKRMRYSPELYFKSPQEMRALFAEVPEASRTRCASPRSAT